VRPLEALICFIITFLLIPVASAQTDADAAYKAERAHAIELYGAQKLLEALPVFEDLASKNPKDDLVLLGLAACLINHSATLSDMEAAGKERVRAKELLVRAQELGNKSQLLQNLLETIQKLPASGQIKYSENATVDDAMRAGEAAFARHDFDEAITDYTKAFDLDPKNYGAALFVGDSYFAKKDFPNAGHWYGRASEINPNVETPYRYYADMLIKNGDMELARTKSIQAVVAEPYNPIPWRGLAAWANANHVQLIRVHINIPPSVSQTDGKNVNLNVQPGESTNAMTAWAAYGIDRALWRTQRFKERFPQETEYRHSLAEESEALEMAAKGWAAPDAKGDPSAKGADPDLDLLAKIHAAGMIEPYVLINGADQGIATDYPGYRDNNRDKLEQYVGQFIVPPTPPKQTP